MNKVRSGFIALLCFILASGAAHTYVFLYIDRDDAIPSYWWLNRVTMKIGALPSNYRQAARSAIDAWNGRSGLRLSYNNQNVSSCNRNDNGISFERTACGVLFGSETLAVAYSRTNPIGRIHSGRIIFNSNERWNLSYGRSAPPYDFRRIAIHEMGHIAGLGHPDEAGQLRQSIMNSRYTRSITEPQADDISGLQELYGRAPLSFAQAVDNSNLNFTFSGNTEWFGTSGSYGGVVDLPQEGSAAYSGNSEDSGQVACVEATAPHTARVSFDWTLASLLTRNRLVFYVNDVAQDEISAGDNRNREYDLDRIDWHTRSHTVTVPNARLRWCYRSNTLGGAGLNRIVYERIQLPPANVMATSGNVQNIRVSWNRAPGSTSYRILRSTSLNGSYSQIATTNDIFYVDAPAQGRLYYYRVRACAVINSRETCSTNSEIASGYRALSPPVGLSASAGSSKDFITIRWNRVTGASRYEVFRDGSSSPITSVSSLSYSDTGAPPSTDDCRLVRYRVRACVSGTGIACSAMSSPASGYRNRTSAGAVGTITDINSQINEVYRSATSDVIVGITACAPDDGSVSYSLEDSAGGLFQISSATGVVRTRQMLSGTSTSHQIIIKALSDDSSTSTRTFVINLFNAVKLHIKTFLEGPLQ